MTHTIALTTTDPERTLEFEFVRAMENAALNVLQWLGRGAKLSMPSSGRASPSLHWAWTTKT